MKAALLLLLLVLVLVIWIASGVHQQQSVGNEERTVQAQITAVARPARTPRVSRVMGDVMVPGRPGSRRSHG